MQTHLIILLFVLLLACSNTNTRSLTLNEETSTSSDTMTILDKAYHHKEFNEMINAIPFDTLYLVKSEIMNDTSGLHLDSPKHVILMERPEGYPKYNFGYNYDKLLLSFEHLEIKQDTARCMILNIYSGVLADFKLKKEKNGWKVLSYEKNMI